MKYHIDYQFLPKSALRPIDDGEIVGIEATDEGGVVVIPDVALTYTLDDATKTCCMRVTGEVRRLLEVVHGEMKRVDIQQTLNLKHEDHFREAYLVPALADNLIEMTIPGKPTSRMQKYRLTGPGWSHTSKGAT